jgi:hypothetical protein
MSAVEDWRTGGAKRRRFIAAETSDFGFLEKSAVSAIQD